MFGGQRVPDRVDLLLHAARVRAEQRQELTGLLDAALGDEPPRTLRDAEEQEEKGRRRKGLDAEHPPPRDAAQLHAGEQVVREERQQDAQHDVELLDGHQPPRSRAGEISAMYRGETTDAPPTARPPRKRNPRKEYQSQGKALPTAETK